MIYPLPANSIIKWPDLEQQFHTYFFSGIHEMKIPDLTKLKQRNDEMLQDLFRGSQR
jgi:hypothetical protein